MSDMVGIFARSNGIAYLHMRDETRKNTFADDFVNALVDGLDRLEREVKPTVCVIHGLPDVFCAGADKQSLLALCNGEVHVKDLVVSEKLLNAPFPVIAAMEGHAVGGGLMLAVCCDIVIAARESRYGATFMSLGFTPGMGCTTLLADLFGPYLAAEMMYSAKLFKGSELAGKGTQLNHILPKAEVMGKAEDIALQIGEKNRESVYLLKYALSARRKKLLTEARVQEDFMHRLSFAFPATKRAIEDLYVQPAGEPRAHG